MSLLIALDPSTIALLSAAGGAIIALLFLLIAMRASRRARLIADLPTSKTTGVFIGLVEVKGTAEVERPLSCFLSDDACVWYSWSVEEHWSRTTTETYTDGDGKTKTRTKHESGWKTVAQGGETTPFYVEDDCGVLRVLPERAEVEGAKVFDRTVGRGDPLYYGKGPSHAVADSDHRRRFTERAVCLHAPIYVVGQARLRDDIVAPEIAYDSTAPMFLISTRSEEQIASSYAWQFWLLGILGVIPAVAGWIIGDIQADGDPSAQIVKYVGVGAAYLVIFATLWVWTVYNSLVGLKRRVDQAWSNVDVQLKRRHDLIPNLVRIIEAVCAHEKDVQADVAALRSQAAATAPGASGPDPQGCATRLIALAEAYPDLKASENYLKLQAELIDTEQRIALARAYYNESVMYYNNRREIFPDSLIASLVGMKPRSYIAADNFERASVEIKFAA